jgi:hypothetical protein
MIADTVPQGLNTVLTLSSVLALILPFVAGSLGGSMGARMGSRRAGRGYYPFSSGLVRVTSRVEM